MSPFTGPTGADSYEDDTGGSPQLDITQGDMHTVVIGGSTYPETILTIGDLTDAPASAAPGAPSGTANEYYMLWTYGTTTYFSEADVDTTESTVLGPQVTYGYGQLTTVGTETQYTDEGTTTGSFNPGPDGTVVVDVPLTTADTGGVSPGSVLNQPTGQTKVEIGTPETGGLLESANWAGPTKPYTLGEICPATGAQGSSGGSGGPTATPEAPLALALPLAGLAMTGGGVWLLRRRRGA